MTSAELIDTATRKVEALAHGLHVLAIQDTTELNYQAHAQRVTGLGTVGNGTDKGLFLHPMVSIDAESGDCLGVAAIYAWLRPAGEDRDYRKLPIEEKESYRWLQVAASAKARLHKAAMITVIADRESDIYEEWTRVPDAPAMEQREPGMPGPGIDRGWIFICLHGSVGGSSELSPSGARASGQTQRA